METPLPVDLNNIILNENAYFYELLSPLTPKEITTFFDESIRDKDATVKFKRRIREPFYDGAKAIAKYSLDIFQFKKKPTFFEKPEEGKWEVKFGIFLLIEYQGYVAIIRKYVSGTKSLYSYIEGIDYNVLTHFLLTNNSKIEKIEASNMNTAENAIQHKVTEAIDLKGIMSRFGASKQILNSMRMDNKGEKQTVSMNTSRINSFKLKNKFNDVILWIIDILKLIERAYVNLPVNNFIDGFAKPLKFESIIGSIEPTYILLRFGTLKDEIDSGIIARSYIKDDSGSESEIDLSEEINKGEKLFKLTKIDAKTYECSDLKVKINDHSITLSLPRYKNIILEYDNGNSINLNQYINTANSFLVNFDKIEYVYSHRKIFEDSKLLGDLPNFFNTFITYPELSDINSEKGKTSPSSTAFESKSLFEFIENKLVPKDTECLICDDMGVEWGDFISISKDSVCFYHAKFHDKSLSASYLEEVFGQAQKNFGFLELTDEMIALRSERWGKTLKQTKINRIRKCPASSSSKKIDKIKEIVNTVSSNPNLRRKVFVVINFISKKDLERSIASLKKGRTLEHGGVTLQILWFVNSLLCSANELNTEFRVICQE